MPEIPPPNPDWPYPQRLMELRFLLSGHPTGYQVEAYAFLVGALSQSVTDEQWDHVVMGLLTEFKYTGLVLVQPDGDQS